MNKSNIEAGQAGTEEQQSTTADNEHVSQPIAKPNVSGCRFRPILFSGEMVRAILEGRKTQTRRIVKFPKDFMGANTIFDNSPFGLKYASTDFLGCVKRLFPKYEIGDILWVRETWRGIEQDFGKPRYEYKATETINLIDKWKPSIFMPREAARIFLKVTNIRVERLHDINNNDALAEGIEWKIKFPDEAPTQKYYRDYMFKERFAAGIMFQAKHSFFSLWQKINGRENYKSNPFVWVIEFERCERPLDSH